MLRVQNNLLINKLKRRGNMKKILLMLSTLALMLAPAIANAGNFTMGVTFSDNSLDTDGTEDIDSNGTIDGEKNVTDDFMVGSIFAEYTNMGDRFGMTVGIDFIPFDADIDERDVAQSALGAASEGAATSGTNAISGSVESHRTIYLQPGISFGTNSMLYLTYGFVSADINARTTSLSHTDINETKDLDGEKVGVGIKRVGDNGMVVKLDYSDTDYDEVSFVTSNNTTGTVDLDNRSLSLSIGKQF